MSLSPAEPALASAPRSNVKPLLWLGLDVVTMLSAMVLALSLLGRTPGTHGICFLGLIAAVRFALFVRMGMYRAILRFSGLHTLFVMCGSVGLGSLAGVAAGFVFLERDLDGLGRAFIVLEGLLTLVACGGSRVLARVALERRSGGERRRALIYGAGSTGELVLRGLSRAGNIRIVGFLDDDARHHGSTIHGRRVLGSITDLEAIARKHRPELLVIAIHNLHPARVRAVVRTCMELGIPVKKSSAGTLAPSGETELTNVPFEDLLRRPTRNLDRDPIQLMVAGRTVLVTGAGGSIGSELSRQVAGLGAGRLVLVENSEASLYLIDARLREEFPQVAVEPVLLDLQEPERLQALLGRTRTEVIFHAAAFKHVPLVEENPFFGVVNNVNGWLNLLETSVSAGVERLVLVSSDKAVRPTSIMGASKRVCELLLQSHPGKDTRLCAVRFGNVLGSSGSVVPLFLSQIAKGGPVTVTHPEMTRYFMLVSEAVELVLHAGSMASEGEIFILDMGEPVSITDMARQLVFLAGYVPEREVAITYTGMRLGEKLNEELLQEEAEQATAVNAITVARSSRHPWGELEARVQRLLEAARREEQVEFYVALRDLVPEWTPSTRWREAAIRSAERRAPEPLAGLGLASPAAPAVRVLRGPGATR